MAGEFPGPEWRIWSIPLCTWKTRHLIHMKLHYWAFFIPWGGHAHTFTCLAERSRQSLCPIDPSLITIWHQIWNYKSQFTSIISFKPNSLRSNQADLLWFTDPTLLHFVLPMDVLAAPNTNILKYLNIFTPVSFLHVLAISLDLWANVLNIKPWV